MPDNLDKRSSRKRSDRESALTLKPGRIWLPALLGALVAICIVIGTALRPDSPSIPGNRNLFDTRAAFEDYVSRLDLASVPTRIAIERLTVRGFQCETFKDASVACFRETRGTICGERQFVDLLVPGKNAAAHAVATRFGRVCL